MSIDNISVDHDVENDVLYVTRNDIKFENISNYGVTENILIRIDVNTHKIEGITIESFSRVYQECKDMDEYHLMEVFDRELELLNASRMVDNVKN